VIQIRLKERRSPQLRIKKMSLGMSTGEKGRMHNSSIFSTTKNVSITRETETAIRDELTAKFFNE